MTALPVLTAALFYPDKEKIKPTILREISDKDDELCCIDNDIEDDQIFSNHHFDQSLNYSMSATDRAKV